LSFLFKYIDIGIKINRFSRAILIFRFLKAFHDVLSHLNSVLVKTMILQVSIVEHASHATFKALAGIFAGLRVMLGYHAVSI
jgi:hypothetical protein